METAPSAKRISPLESNEATTEKAPYVHPWVASLPRFVRVAIVAIIQIPWVLSLAMLFYQGQWLPTQEWLTASNNIAILTWVAWVAPMLLLLLRIPPKQHWKNPNDRVDEIAKRVFQLLGIALMLYPFATGFVRIYVPAIHANFRGTDVSHKFVIEDANGSNYRHCRKSVSLQDMPFLANLCNVPEEFRNQLRPGMTLIITGKGSWMGVKPHELRIDRGN